MKKVSSWRPKDWDKHSMDEIVKLPPDVYPLVIPHSLEWDIQRRRLFEAGADAMLEALRSGGWRVKGESIIPAHGEYPEIHLDEKLHGWLVFIPEEVKK